MDHILELPDDPAFEPITVPFIEDGFYDNQGFLDFPSRQGFTISTLQRGELGSHTVTDVRRFLQGWLFFGALSEFLGTTLDPLDFVCEDELREGKSRLSTKPLGEHLARWRDRMDHTDPTEKKSRVFAILSYLEVAGEATRSDIMSDLMGPELHLAVSVLGSTLDKARLSLRLRIAAEDVKISSRGQRHHDDYVLFGTNVLLTQRMLTSGWCPNQVHRSSRALTPSGMYFASMLKLSTPTKDHSACTKDDCMMNHIEEATYQTKHVSPGCDCAFIGPDMKEVAAILESGLTPVIAIKTGLNAGNCKLRAIPYRPALVSRTPYVAISHVWGDGMGNANANALPSCQIQRLSSLVKAVYNTISDCCNSSLEPRAQRLGDDKISLDDSLLKFKLNTAPAVLSLLNSRGPIEEEMSGLSDQEYHDRLIEEVLEMTKEVSGGSAYNEFYADLKLAHDREHKDVHGTHEGSEVGSSARIPSSDSGFHWLINDAASRDFMAYHGSSGDFNLDWKAYDSKSQWELSRLLENVNMGEEVLIWMDTLCVPLEKRLRKMAIRRMKEVYAYAEKVLVLDSQIQASSGKKSYEESLVRINLSGWMQRAWTLEEATVGGILLFQFNDGVFDLWKFGRSWLRRANRSIVLSDASRPWSALRRTQQPRHHIEQMQRAYDGLEDRTTSKMPDMNLIFSFLMGISPDGLIAPKRDRSWRAQTFFNLQDTFPTGLLWVSSKIKDENYQSVNITKMDAMAMSVQASKDPRSS